MKLNNRSLLAVLIFIVTSHGAALAVNEESLEKKRDRISEAQWERTYDPGPPGQCSVGTSAQITFHGQGDRQIITRIYKLDGLGGPIIEQPIDERITTLKPKQTPGASVDVVLVYEDLFGGNFGDYIRLEWSIEGRNQWGDKKYSTKFITHFGTYCGEE